MATTLTQSPQAVNLSGMPVFHSVATTETGNTLKILAFPKNTDLTIGPDAMSPYLLDANHVQADFNLMEYYKPLVSTSYKPSLSGYAYQETIPLACIALTAQFYCYGYNPPQNFEGVTGSALYYMVGAIPRWMQSTFFTTYANFFAWITALSPALTFYPASVIKKVLPTQPERIYWLQKHAATSLRTRIKLYFTDGTNSGDDQLTPPGGTVGQYQVVAFKAGYTELSIATLAGYYPTKTLLKYSVTVQAGANWSEERFYQPDLNYHEHIRYLVFRNSLCGYDCLPLTGEATKSSEYTRDFAERTLNNLIPTASNKVTWRTRMNEVVSVNTGWLSKLEADWLNELYLSQEVYEVMGTVMTPVIIKGDKLLGPADENNQYSALIEYEKIYYAE